MNRLAALLILGVAGSASGQEAWPPAVPALSFAPRPAAHAAPLHPSVFEEVLPALARKDVQGLGPEAARARAWSAGKADISLAGGRNGWRLDAGAGASMPLSNALGEALDHARQYVDACARAQGNPVTARELEDAALRPAAVETLRGMFDKVVDTAGWLDGQPLFYEIGGEATLDSSLRLDEIADPTREVLNEISKNIDDPRALDELYGRHPADMAWIDGKGQLRKALDRWRESPQEAGKKRLVRMSASLIVSLSGDAYTFDPDAMLASMLGREWHGRHAGLWHLHPPVFTPSSWDDGTPPSPEDLDLASRHGQLLTVSFHPRGFDLYDLSSAVRKGDLSQARVIRYRSDEWQRHFNEKHALFLKTRPPKRR